MSEPYLTTREMVERIESEMRKIQADVHKIQVEQARSNESSLSAAAEDVITRAKAVMWAAVCSGVAATAAAIVAIVKK